MKYLILMLKGMAFGLSNIVPGLTGGSVLILMGIYEEFVEAVGNLALDRRRWRQYVPFLAAVGVGAIVAMIGFAGVLSWLLEHYRVPMLFLFQGLLIGTVPSLLKMHNDMRVTPVRMTALVIGLAVVVALKALEQQGFSAAILAHPNSIGGMAYALITGFVAGGANVTPGISGSYMFLLAGMYAPIMAALRDLSRLTVQWAILVPVGIGAALGIVALSKLIDMAIKRAPSVTYYAILGLLLGSVYGLWPDDWALTNPLVLIAAFAVGVAVPMLLTGGQARTASKALI